MTETSLFSVFLCTNALQKGKNITVTNLAVALDLLFLSHVEILFPFRRCVYDFLQFFNVKEKLFAWNLSY